MLSRKKYFDSKKEAIKARQAREAAGQRDLHVFKMPKGSRRAGKYAVCSYMEYLNS